MSGWEDVGRRQASVFKRWFLGLMLFACLLLVVVAKVSPEQDTYTSNADAPLVTRTLVPRETTTIVKPFPTTTARVSSAVSVEKVLDELVIIDGKTVYRVPRSSAVMVALYILLENTK